MQTLFELPSRWPKTVLAAILGITALAVAVLIRPGLGMDPNPYPLAPSHPSMVAYHQLKREYTGTGETALILLRAPRTVFNTGTLSRIDRLTTALEQVTLVGPEDSARLAAFLPRLSGEAHELVQRVLADGISRADDVALSELGTLIELEGEPVPGLTAALDELRLRLYPVRKVTSLANAEHIVARGDELVVGNVYDTVPTSAGGLAAAEAQVAGNRIFRKLLVSEDGRSTGILVETYIPDSRSELMLALNGAIDRLMAEIPGPEEVHVAGMPVMAATAVATMQSDNSRFFPVVIALVLAVLTITFRTVGGVLLPMAVVVISVIWTLALMAGLGVPLNMMTTALPVFLITIGVADGIHLVSEFKDQLRRRGDRGEAVRATMRHLAVPVIMTSLTTGVGFVALAFTDISNIREFGIFVAVGVLVAMVFSLTFIPAALALGRKGAGRAPRLRRPSFLARFDALTLNALAGLGSLAVRRSGWVLLAGALLVGGGIYGTTRVVADNDFVRYFDADMPIVQSTHAMDEQLAGSNAINLIVTGPADAAEPFKEPANLAAVEGLQRDLERLPYVGKSLSLVDVLERINRVMHGDDPAFDRLPQDAEGIPGRNLVAQYLLLYENGGGDNLTDFTDSQFRTLNVRLNLSTRSSQDINALVAEAQAYAGRHFPPGMTLRVAGSAELSTATNNEIVSSQMRSLLVSLAIVFGLLLVEFRSASKGLLAMIPLAVTAVLNFGAMGLLGISLNIGTAIVSSIVIGIGVDFAIHYVSRLQVELPGSSTLEQAVRRTMRASGKAITANAATVALGFLALRLSDMVPMRNVGWMVSQTLLVSAVATLVLLPAAVAFFRPAFARQPEQPQELAAEAA